MTKATLKDYQVLLDCKDREISLLKFKLENFESLQRAKCCECEREAIQDLSDLHIKMIHFEDEYFKGLDTKTIAELAKKSIRITAENCKLEHILEKIKKIAEHAVYKCQTCTGDINIDCPDCTDGGKSNG